MSVGVATIIESQQMSVTAFPPGLANFAQQWMRELIQSAVEHDDLNL